MPQPPFSRRSFLALGLAFAGAGPSRAGTREEAFVRTLAEELSGLARAGAGPSAYARFLAERGDMSAIAVQALGPWRQRLPDRFSTAYLRAVTRYAALNAAQGGRRFARSDFRIINSGPNQVTGELRGNSRATRIVFRLSRARSGLKVRDVSVDGMWLGIQIRSAVVARLNQTRGDFGDLVAFLSSGYASASGNG